MTKPVQFPQIIRTWMDVFMNRSWRGMNHFAKSVGLTMPQFGILMRLHYHGPFGMSEIGEGFDITPAAASQLVDKLVQSGLIERVENPSDRRAKQLSLSPKGSQLIEEGIQERYRWMDELLAQLTTEERGKVTESLALLTEKARAVDK